MSTVIIPIAPDSPQSESLIVVDRDRQFEVPPAAVEDPAEAERLSEEISADASFSIESLLSWTDAERWNTFKFVANCGDSWSCPDFHDGGHFRFAVRSVPRTHGWSRRRRSLRPRRACRV